MVAADLITRRMHDALLALRYLHTITVNTVLVCGMSLVIITLLLNSPFFLVCAFAHTKESTVAVLALRLSNGSTHVAGQTRSEERSEWYSGTSSIGRALLSPHRRAPMLCATMSDQNTITGCRSELSPLVPLLINGKRV